MITWKAPSENDIPQGAKVRYRVRLLKNGNNQLYRPGGTSLTAHPIPEVMIKAEDLSKIYVRVECQGWDQNAHEHFLPLELQTSNILHLKEILEKQ